MKQNEGKKERKSLIFRFLNTVEQVGNRLPHPITMFAALALFIVLLSGILAAAGISAEGEVIDSKTMEVTTQTVSAVSLLDRDGLVYMLTHMVSNFTEFAPLGVVLVTMLGGGERILVCTAEKDCVGDARKAGNTDAGISGSHV